MIYKTGMICPLLILSAVTATHYVQTGADIHFCRFQCYEPQGILQLRCNVTLVLAECWNSVPIIHHILNQRLLLNHDNGCWMMKNAQKNDTGLYETLFFSSANKFKILESTEIIVLGSRSPNSRYHVPFIRIFGLCIILHIIKKVFLD
uniref:Uncharacterized protein n=1 Tax=Pyxicephalus adspersus TaxID=30357 RepID=A0AAV3A5A8_PYXAD|nr:TPA: hypothetical protein GDO54_018385 [Pyxicephalus adspersus]